MEWTRNIYCQGEGVIFKHSRGAFRRGIVHMLLYVNKQLFYKLPGIVIYSAEKHTPATRLKIS